MQQNTLLLPTIIAIAIVSKASAIASIHDCDSFQEWFRAQPASVLTLASGDSHRLPKPRSETSLALDLRNATWFKGSVGGGGCLSGWYDPAHHIAAIRDQYDTYQDILVFYTTSAPVGVRTRDLSQIRLENGVHLGMTRKQVEAIEGDGFVMHLPDGAAIHYRWNDQITHNLSFRFRNDRLIAIDYGYGA